jgi:hypothetical protein
MADAGNNNYGGGYGGGYPPPRPGLPSLGKQGLRQCYRDDSVRLTGQGTTNLDSSVKVPGPAFVDVLQNILLNDKGTKSGTLVNRLFK